MDDDLPWVPMLTYRSKRDVLLQGFKDFKFFRVFWVWQISRFTSASKKGMIVIDELFN
jgi:hypothetical protein